MVDQIPSDVPEEEDKKKRRRLIFWLFFGATVVIVVLLFGVLRRDGNVDALATTTSAVAQTTSTTTASEPITNTTQLPATTTTVPPTVDGVWAVAVDVTVATGTCAGEEADEFDADQVTIRQDGSTLTIVGLGFPKDTQEWEGKIEGNVISFGGTRTEDDGVTSAVFTMEVDFETMTMTGKETWTWEGPGGTCPNSESIVTATRTEP